MDTALKQRLIGAVVLVALAVIFLPMLVKGPAPDSGVSDVPLEVPAAPGGEYETRELPLVTPGSAPAQGAVGLDGQVAAPAAEPAPAEGALQPPATAGGDFAVSFGAYATQADADAVLARVKQAKLPGFVEPATINGKPAFRVRVGPYADRAQAEAARALEAGRRIAERAVRSKTGRRATVGAAVGDDAGVVEVEVKGADLGRFIGNPAAFWAGACAVQAADADALEALDAEIRWTAAQMSAGNLDRVREALVGQAVWLGTLAVNLASAAGGARDEDGRQTMRLALAAQRQAAQTLASAAALARLEVRVTDGD